MKKEKQKTREEEIEGKVEAHTNVSMKAYDKGIQQGKQSALKQFEDEVKEKVEKLKDDTNKYYSQSDGDVYGFTRKEFIEIIDKIFGDEE